MQHLEVSGAVRPLKWSLGVKWLREWVFNATPRPLYPRKRATVPVLQEAVWVSLEGYEKKEKRTICSYEGSKP